MARKQPIELFMPPNVLKAKVGGSADIDLDAIARAETAMQSLKGEFHGWAAEALADLTEAYDGYARAASPGTRAELERAAHDLTGHAGSFGFPLIAAVAGSLSRLLRDLPADRELPAALVDAHVDAALVIFRDKTADEKNEVARILCAELAGRVTRALKKKPRT